MRLRPHAKSHKCPEIAKRQMTGFGGMVSFELNGTVEEVLPDKGKVRVSVSLFGRPTSVELDYLQLKGY